MPRPDVLVLVLAGGKGSRLDLLTRHRAKPAVPFAGSYRLIDFPLSNCLHSGISDVWVLQQYQPASLNDHLANGRPWDLDRTTGGLLVLPPYQGGDAREGFTQGTADGLWRNAPLLRQVDPRTVVVVSADAVYRSDYRALVEAHRASGATLTAVTARVDAADAGRYGVVRTDGDRVVDYAYKPDEPASDVVTNEVFALDPGPVLDLLESFADGDDDEELGDLGDALLPRLVADGEVRHVAHDGYWRDVGTLDAYWSASMDFAQDDPPLDLDAEDWPVRTQGGHRAPAWFAASGSAARSLVSAGTHVAGHVVHSVLSPGVVVEDGAVVEDSVVLPGAVIGRGAHVRRAVVDDGVRVGAGARVGGDGDLVLLGDRTVVPDGAEVAPGSRVPTD